MSRRFIIAVAAIGISIGIAQADDASPADSAAERRRQIASMSPADKERLRRRKQWFDKLDPAEQVRLRRLHEQLQKDPNAERLRRVMHGYYQWLDEQPPYRRAELQELEPAQRVERIKELREEEARSDANRPKREDLEGLFRWMGQYVKKNVQQIMQTLPEPRKTQIGDLSVESRRRLGMWMMWQRWQWSRPDKMSLLTEADLADLRSELSEDTRKRLEQLSPQEQRQDIADWMRHAVRHRFDSRRSKDGPLPLDLQKKLDQFFEQELTEEQRYRLLSMSGDEMQRELRRMYLARLRPAEMPPFRGHGPPRGMRGGPPGPRREYNRPTTHGPPGGSSPPIRRAEERPPSKPSNPAID